MTFVIVAKPSVGTCYVVRIVPGVAFAMIYGALLTKTNRIARILAGSKKRILTKKPRFLSTTAQVPRLHSTASAGLAVCPGCLRW